MKKILHALFLFAAIGGLAAADAPPAVQTQFDKMSKAITEKNYEAFLADADDPFRATVTQEIFDQASDDISGKLGGGYSATFLGELNKSGYKVYYWKLVPKNGGDDYLATLSVQDGKVGGFSVQ